MMMIRSPNLLTNGFSISLLITMALASFLASICTIILENTILSVIFLIFLFALIGVILIFLGSPYIGFSYMIIYVGAVSVLFIFILMLVKLRFHEVFIEYYNVIVYGSWLLYIGVMYSGFLISKTPKENNGDAKLKFWGWLFPFPFWTEEVGTAAEGYTTSGSESLGNSRGGDVVPWRLFLYYIFKEYVSSIAWDECYQKLSKISGVGVLMFSTNSLLLIITGLILLLTMAGAIMTTVSTDTSNE